MKKCAVCGSNAIVSSVNRQTFEYKSKTLEISDYQYLLCTNCGEEFVDEAYEKTIEKELREFHRKVDGLLSCHEIQTIRMSLGFTQDMFGEILGGGKKAFARYENGTVTQSKPMDNLLKILRDHPECLDSIIPEDQRLDVALSSYHFVYNPNPRSVQYQIKVAS